jgi:hypothetical protein
MKKSHSSVLRILRTKVPYVREVEKGVSSTTGLLQTGTDDHENKKIV